MATFGKARYRDGFSYLQPSFFKDLLVDLEQSCSEIIHSNGATVEYMQMCKNKAIVFLHNIL